MGNLFGIRRRAPIVTDQDRAVLQLKQQRDKIKIYQKRTEDDMIRNNELAQKLYQNNQKERALIVLRRRKCLEKTLAQTDQQLATLQQLVDDIEFNQIQVSVVEGLRVGNEALKQLTSLINIDDLQQMMDDTEEAAEKQREITSILSRASERLDVDDDELLKELQSYQTVQPEREAPVADEMKHEEEQPEESTTPSLAEDDEAPQVVEDKSLADTIDRLPSVPKDELSANEGEPKEAKKVTKKVRQMEPAQ